MGQVRGEVLNTGPFVPKTFTFYGHQETAGVWVNVTTDSDTDAQATYALPPKDGADGLIAGILNRVHFQFNWANAVTLDAVRVFRHTSPSNYANRVFKIYETPAGVNHADDTEYDYTELEIPFRLVTTEKIYVNFDWSGAPGNIGGFVSLDGLRLI